MTGEGEKSWTNRMTDVIYECWDKEHFFKLLEEDWTVEEYMDAVSGLGEPGVLIANENKRIVVEGWKRAEYVNSLIIDYLKNGQQTVL
jgi:hypothetical protein